MNLKATKHIYDCLQSKGFVFVLHDNALHRPEVVDIGVNTI